MKVDLIKYALGMDQIPLTSEGIARVEIKDSVIINFEPSIDNQGFYLYAVIGQTEEKVSFKDALEGNLFGNKTGRASIGLYPPLNLLILFQYFKEDGLESDEFKQSVELFCQYLFYWIDKLKKPIPLQDQLRGLQEPSNMKIFFA